MPEDVRLWRFITVQDSAEAIAKLKELKAEMNARGFLTASVDSLAQTGDTLSAFFTLGHQYEWAYLRKGNVPEDFISGTLFREKLFTNRPFLPHEFSKLTAQLLQTAENRGYPFATVSIDSLEILNHEIRGNLNLNRNVFTTIDSVILKGNIRVSQKYLENFLGIKPGMPYSQNVLNKIPTRLRELSFVKVIKPFEIGMRPGKADVYLYLDQRKASNFNGIVGIMPESQTGKTIITGDVELNLINSFKRGEEIHLKWQRLHTRTQELNLDFNYPYMFHTPFGLELGMELYRRDTLFTNLKSRVGTRYSFKGGKYVRLFFENHQSNVISSGAFSINEFIDSRTNLFGVGLNFIDLDYKFNPSRGYFADVSIAAGKKKILKNPKVAEEEYHGMDTETDIYNIEGQTGVYFSIAKRSVILLRLRGAYLLNDQMFKNELYRIGGINTIRGFNEQSVFASGYGVGTAEYRFLLEENSNLFLFYDYGYFEDLSESLRIGATLMGMGAGINFETNAGIFSLTYALGSQANHAFEIRNGKIHFGFISFF